MVHVVFCDRNISQEAFKSCESQFNLLPGSIDSWIGLSGVVDNNCDITFNFLIYWQCSYGLTQMFDITPNTFFVRCRWRGKPKIEETLPRVLLSGFFLTSQIEGCHCLCLCTCTSCLYK